MGVEVEVQQGMNLGAYFKDDVSTVSTIAAVGAAKWFEFFAVHRDAAVAAVASGEV